ncbi:programmed cell death 1 ligand 1 isoform X6 [Maylandia zebra]|uniref:programmed cell death 1 ligand 1 isoform X6 n=1 Tax=Maylandia zebra TaxID=106582 RepID=UPI00403C7577
MKKIWIMDFMPFLVVPLWTSILHLDFVKGSFVVDVTQSSYQAEENHNITLEWTFTTKPDTPLSALKILCSLNNDLTLYYLRDGVEFSEVQDKKFSGRVQSDKDALREGRIRLQLSRLRTEDSGLYLCEVDTGYGRGYNSCRVTVSDANFTKSSTMTMPLLSRSLQTPDHQDTTPTNGRFRVAVVLIAFISAVAVAGLTVYFCCHHQHQTQKHPEEDETETLPV